MKADKILYGMACIGMGVLLHSTFNKSEVKPAYRRTPDKTLLGDSVRFKQTLNNDTLYLSNAIKTDSLKMLKKVGK